MMEKTGEIKEGVTPVVAENVKSATIEPLEDHVLTRAAEKAVEQIKNSKG